MLAIASCSRLQATMHTPFVFEERGARLLVVGCQLSVVSCQLSVVSCQLLVARTQGRLTPGLWPRAGKRVGDHRWWGTNGTIVTMERWIHWRSRVESSVARPPGIALQATVQGPFASCCSRLSSYSIRRVWGGPSPRVSRSPLFHSPQSAVPLATREYWLAIVGDGPRLPVSPSPRAYC
ncbi:hypothetical protein L207DRAFT_115765 [Hyaloscypha variabilis F]|uniref:Uncharacterized protein n=1 Tax=Hyaloscypha variabilis (strain UAMH 11265 / GT02V1 / F) TaxID=1149755 RepID=A0A2J6RAB7_HYAVF|nr:hypothetical protein L207DRAFT_115765 [Hyaloscypha variabilis F]